MGKLSHRKTAVLLLSAFIAFIGTGCTSQSGDFTAVSGYYNTTAETDITSGVQELAAENLEMVAQKYTAASVKAEKKSACENFSLSDVPEYTGEAYAVINDNVPFFDKSELTVRSFEKYSEFDDLGRCGTAYACIGRDIMPTEERGKIGSVRPTGWHTVKYDNVDGKYLYNRCHLIGYQLSGENANEQNLITGTRYLNTEGMLPFEDMTANYVEETSNHVMYRVTPMFDGNNLLASGVLMEGYSVEDKGEGICFCVFCYNVQPDIIIDYANGSSGERTVETTVTAAPKQTEAYTTSDTEKQSMTYILNTNTKKFHYPSCSSVEQMKEKNRKEFSGDREDVISQGYSPCKRCKP